MELVTASIIHESSVAYVRRGVLSPGDTRVVIKSVPAGSTQPALRGRIKYEYELLCKLAAANVQRVLRPLSLYDEGGEFGLVTHDTGAQSLRAVMPLSPDEVLNVAIQVCEALEGVHRLGITHKDIHPGNIVFNSQTGSVELIDFGIAAQMEHEAQPVDSPASIEGTLAYVSPEQTGRMTRSLDHRSDFYSLGITLYELLSGRTPFQDSDPAQLVHAHLAKVPADLQAVAPKVSPALAAVVKKLLAKSPEERYQSAVGLRHDLVRIRADLRSGQTAALFPLGRQDFSEHFMVSERIYGREAEQGGPGHGLCAHRCRHTRDGAGEGPLGHR